MHGHGADDPHDNREATAHSQSGGEHPADRRPVRPTLVTLAVASGLLAVVLLAALVVRIGQPATVQSSEIDLAGLQRRLGERIALDATRLQLDPADARVREQMTETALRLRQVRTGLLRGDDTLGLDGVIPTEAEALYGDDGLDLDARLRRFEDAALAIAATPGPPEPEQVAVILAETADERLVSDLSVVVAALATDAERSRDAEQRQVLLMLLGLAAFGVITMGLVVASERTTRRALHEMQALSHRLDESEMLHRRTVDSLLDGVVVVDRDLHVVGTNRVAATLMRRTVDPTDASCDTVEAIALPTLLDEDGSPLDDDRHPALRAIADQCPVAGELVGAELDDGLHWFRCTATPLVGRSASDARTVITFSDVTQELRLTAHVEQQEQRFRLAVLHAPIAKAIVVADGTIVEANPAFAELIARPVEELVGLRFQEITHPDDIDADVANVERLLAGDADTYRMEKRYLRPDGTAVHVLLAVSIVRQTGTDPVFIAQVVDLTDRTRAEAAQLAALEHERRLVAELRTLDEAKDQLVSTVSHELRTPLTSTIGYLELLLDGAAGDVTPAQRKMLDIAKRNGDRLLNLIEDLLLASEIEHGQLPSDHRPVLVDEVIDTAVRTLVPMAMRDDVHLRLHPGATGARVYGDTAQLERILVNITGNAVKFTPAGGRVDVRMSQDHTHGQVVIEVSDTGVGIPVDEQPRIFERFFRTRSSQRSETPGSGLGLAIAANLVELHHGSIAVTSTEGVGTTVTVTLPALGRDRNGAPAVADQR